MFVGEVFRLRPPMADSTQDDIPADLRFAISEVVGDGSD